MYARKHHSIASTWLNDILNLFYPNLCVACGRLLQGGEESICLFCRHDLPETDFHKKRGNPIHQKFYGRLLLDNAASLYHFHKGARVQHLMHAFKYEGKKQIGIELGKLYGHYLKEAPGFSSVQIVIPVPLHRAKLHQRGFNQSEIFSRGLAETMHIQSIPEGLERIVFTETQTHKNRMERWENVKSVFKCKHAEKINGNHILLVDDVVTTGATLEACGQELFNSCRDIRLSVATIACAD